MKSWVLAAGLLAAAASGPVMAADLDEGPPPDRYGSAYDDPRYADIYRYPDERRPVPRAPVYGDRYEDREDYPEPRRYSYSDPRPSYRGACVPREQIKYRLQDRGWHDFRDPEIRGEIATFIARRPSGHAFELTVDRCSGEIVNVRRLDGPQGPYAYGPGPRRWDRY